MAKKTTTTTAKVAPVVKEAAVEVKETVKKEAVKAEPVKEEAKKAPAKKETAKAETKKTPAKKAATKTTTAKKAVKTAVTVQFGGQEVSMDVVVENVKKAFEAEGNKVSAIKDLQVYVKPEEYAAYYVINQDITGKINLF